MFDTDLSLNVVSIKVHHRLSDAEIQREAGDDQRGELTVRCLITLKTSFIASFILLRIDSCESSTGPVLAVSLEALNDVWRLPNKQTDVISKSTSVFITCFRILLPKFEVY